MKKESRLILACAALLILPAFVLPLWSIGVVAPQYRDGLGMHIMLSDVRGHQPHDIQNLNILNHYIGMKPIVPDEVGALKVMPWAAGFLVVLGLVAALVGRRGLLIGWLGSFTLLGVAGLVEFYRWLHDYGTNLDPMAAIKVPGLSYQPPLVGREQILNMTASSWPSWGTLFITLAGLTGALVLWHELRPFRSVERLGSRRAARSAERPSGGLRPAGGIAAGALLLLVACGPPGPPAAAESGTSAASPLAGLTDDHCGGTIGENRFGGELVTRDGERYRFRSTECMAAFVIARGLGNGELREVRVVEYTHGGRLIDATSARFIRSEQRPSPDGLGLLATDRELMSYNLRRFFGGEELTWEEVLELVRRERGEG